jgi:hypothetical protein
LGGEVELLERLGRGEPGEAQPAGEAALFGGLDLDVEQVGEELGVAGLVTLGALEGGGEVFGGGGELEVGQVAAQPLVGGVLVHRATLAMRA